MAIDENVDKIVGVLEVDIFGQVSEEREVAAIRTKNKEARKCKSPMSYKLLTQAIAFKANGKSIQRIMQGVTETLSEATKPSVKEKISTVLRSISR